MNKKLKQVEEFQKAFGANVRYKPTLIDKKTALLRFDLMSEENEEYITACVNNDLIEVADALGDMLYILYGTILEHGMQYKIDEVFNEIHKSNMSKLDENGKPIINGLNGVLDKSRPIGKVLKGANYFKPNIKKIIKN